MQNKIPIMLLYIALVGTSLHAKSRGEHVTKEKMGQKYYIAACSKCHGAGKITGNMATHKEWKALLGNNASELIYLHKDVYENQDTKDATVAIDYLKSRKFFSQKRELLKFLQEFASDSANIPTCY